MVSAVGHEIDFTISDFVADVRAATPSAAAEIITEGAFASREFAAAASGRLQHLARRQFEGKADAFTLARGRLARVHPRRRINDGLQLLDDLREGLMRRAKQGIRQQRLSSRNLFERLRRVRPPLLLKQRREVLVQGSQRLRELARVRVRERARNLETLEARLRLLGPEQVLARGYSITMDAATGKVLRDAAKVKAGQRLKTRLKLGEVLSRVEPA